MPGPGETASPPPAEQGAATSPVPSPAPPAPPEPHQPVRPCLYGVEIMALDTRLRTRARRCLVPRTIAARIVGALLVLAAALFGAAKASGTTLYLSHGAIVVAWRGAPTSGQSVYVAGYGLGTFVVKGPATVRPAGQVADVDGRPAYIPAPEAPLEIGALQSCVEHDGVYVVVPTGDVAPAAGL